MKTNLVLQSFGRESEYRRAILTILSYYANTSLPIEQTRVVLFTDNAGYFEPYVHGLPVDYVMLTHRKISSMRGSIDFLHRMKIAVIEEAFGIINGNMLYADSDTFFIADPTGLVQQAAPDKSFMHLWEYRFESMRTLKMPMAKTFHAFLDLIEKNTFKLSDGSLIKVSSEQVSWNAGVMIFHASHARFIPDVYALTDQFYPPTKNHASEQYAFSVLLQNHTEINACDEVIYHYWYRVKKQIIDLFLANKLTEEWSNLALSKKLEDIKLWIKTLPALFDSHILTIKDNAIQALNENNYNDGYKYAWKAILNNPFDLQFLKDLLYHTKKIFVKK